MNRRLRYEVLRRDGFTCRYCGGKAPDVKLQVDHVVPLALGGTDDPGNLVTACFDCNNGKSSAAPDEATIADVQDDALRWAAAIKAAAREQNVRAEIELFAIEEFDAVWDECADRYRWQLRRPGDWRSTIRTFFRAGLQPELMTDLLEQALEKKPHAIWPYWCGMCWRTLEQRQARAAEILAEDQDGVGA